jgi:hypothetical protein
VAAWDEGDRIIEKAKLFSGGAFLVLLALAIYALYRGSIFDTAYFGLFSAVSLGLYIYVRRTFRTKAGHGEAFSNSTQSL